MAVGIPVVASPVGINVDLAIPGETGFLSSTPEAWVHALRTLLHNPQLRIEMGQNGRKLIEKNFSLEINARKLAQTFRSWMESHARATS
jgi:glycosyltransferase involved in cell wall biosynthesis